MPKRKRFNPALQLSRDPIIPPNHPHGLFFIRSLQHPKTNWLVAGDGPDYVAQASAILDRAAWSVLDADILGNAYTQQDETLLRSVNALKVALQTYGLTPPRFDITTQKNANNEVFHTNIRGKHVTYEVEWALVDREKRILALVGFEPHENYKFTQKPLTAEQKAQYLNNPKNVAELERDRVARESLCQKEQRVIECPPNAREQALIKDPSKRFQGRPGH